MKGFTGNPKDKRNDELEVINALCAAADISIASVMVALLVKNKGDFSQTNSMINRLVRELPMW
jgi:hypothetical protein